MSTFKTIVVDPPWQVSAGRTIGNYIKAEDGSQPFGVRNNAARKLSYPSMTAAQIQAIKVPAAENAHLYLWTINKYIPHAFAILNSWGFKYSTMLVWAKKPMGGGLGGDAYGLATEYCLFGRRGVLPAAQRMGRNWWDWKRPYKNGAPQHSAKPPDFFKMVEAVSPGPYLEMFARNPREGWQVWGDEVVSDLEIGVRS